MAEITRKAIARVGVDLSKRVYQVHAVDRAGCVVLARAFSVQRFVAPGEDELPAGCVVAMESCSGAHHVARRLRAIGLDARLLAEHFVSPYLLPPRLYCISPPGSGRIG
jgi:transposase